MKTLLDTNQLAELLNVRPWTIRSWTAQNRLPYIKVGRLVRFDSDDIRRWLADRTHCAPVGDRRNE